MGLGTRHGLILPLVLLTACERGEVKHAHEAMRLVQAMGEELKATAAGASDRFSHRADFEELRRAFGDDRFDAGTPLGPGFQVTLSQLLQDLQAELEKEPRDVYFVRKAVRRVRHFHQWWLFTRQELEIRLERAAKGPEETRAHNLLGGRVQRRDVVLVLSETIQVVKVFEDTALRCIQGLEAIIART